MNSVESITCGVEYQNNNYKKIIFLCLVLFAVFSANIHTATSILPPMNDDPQRYYDAVHDAYAVDYLDIHYLHRGVKYALFNLMSISPQLAKTVNVLIFCLMSSLLYIFLVRSLRRAPIYGFLVVSLVATVPGQVMIPASIESSYNVYGFCAYLLSMIFCFQYLEEKSRNKQILSISIAATTGWLAAESMGMFPLLVPAFVILILAYKVSLTRKSVVLSLLFSLVLWKFFQVFFNPRGNEKRITNTFDTIASRVRDFFDYASSMPELLGGYWTEAWFVIIAIWIGSVIYMYRKSYSPSDEHQFTDRHILLFGVVLAISTAIPVIVFGKVYRPRYGFLPSIGVSLVQALLILFILEILFKKRVNSILTCIFIVVFSVVIKKNAIELHAQKFNTSYLAIEKLFANENFPQGSQLVLVGDIYPQGKYFRRSSGMLMYISGRKDVVGNLPFEYSFYDPFSRKGVGNYQMGGLSLDRPLFLFYLQDRDSAVWFQYKLALRVINDESGYDWYLYEMHENSGNIEVLFSGKSRTTLDETLLELERNGLERCEIFWAGCEDRFRGNE